MHAACERARDWASAELDGELSSFERVLLTAHLDGCPSCREFQTAIGGITSSLRSARPEPLDRLIEIGRIRRRVRLRIAPAVAAMVVAAVGLGSILTSSELRSRSVDGTSATAALGSGLAAVDTMNLRTARALEAAAAAKPAAPSASRSLASMGGPVVQER